MTILDTAGGGCEGDVLAVAAAMLRYGLPDAGAEGVRLEASRNDAGTLLRLIFPASDASQRGGGDADALMLIDSMADRWGSHGGTELPLTLWALLR